MTTTTRWQRPLTDNELARITAAIEAAETPVEALCAAIIGVFEIGLHDQGSSWAEVDQVKPWDYAIPEPQWHAIGAALLARSGSDLNRTNLLLDWMNKGPSTYQPTKE